MDDNPLAIPFRNRVNGSLNRGEVSSAIDIDLDRVVGTNLFCQERRIYHCCIEIGGFVMCCMGRRDGDGDNDQKGNVNGLKEW